jgi:hypothetical protein
VTIREGIQAPRDSRTAIYTSFGLSTCRVSAIHYRQQISAHFFLHSASRWDESATSSSFQNFSVAMHALSNSFCASTLHHVNEWVGHTATLSKRVAGHRQRTCGKNIREVRPKQRPAQVLPPTVSAEGQSHFSRRRRNFSCNINSHVDT